MVYTHKNVQPGTTVCDLDSGERLERVRSINTDTGEIETYMHPFVITASGDVATETIRFAAVWPIHDGGVPLAFHCHGRR